MWPYQTYKLLYSKGNHEQNWRTAYELGENICKWCDKGLISKTYEQLTQLNNNNNKNPVKKWAKHLNRYFFQRRHTDGQQAHQKMLHMANY